MSLRDLKIFLSSTVSDLEPTRRSILKFLGVLKSDLISMETFGSDETIPKELCLKKVRSANFFIGVYAERYGSIDKTTGLSITELEYREAYEMMRSGELSGLLVYLIDPRASWPLNLIEENSTSRKKLKSFKQRLRSNHTVSFFKSADDLPFLVLRDVIRKVGIGSQEVLSRKATPVVRRLDHLDRPVGMEFYTEELADFSSDENRKRKLSPIKLFDIQRVCSSVLLELGRPLSLMQVCSRYCTEWDGKLRSFAR